MHLPCTLTGSKFTHSYPPERSASFSFNDPPWGQVVVLAPFTPQPFKKNFFEMRTHFQTSITYWPNSSNRLSFPLPPLSVKCKSSEPPKGVGTESTGILARTGARARACNQREGCVHLTSCQQESAQMENRKHKHAAQGDLDAFPVIIVSYESPALPWSARLGGNAGAKSSTPSQAGFLLSTPGAVAQSKPVCLWNRWNSGLFQWSWTRN